MTVTRIKIVGFLVVQIIIFILYNQRLVQPLEEYVITTQLLQETNENAGMIQLDNGMISFPQTGTAQGLKTPDFDLPPGSYQVVIPYHSDTDGRGSIEESAGVIEFYSPDGTTGLISDAIDLVDGNERKNTRITISSPVTMRNLFAGIAYYGVGSLSIGDISITESMEYRMVQLLGSILCLVLFNVFCFKIVPRWKQSRESKIWWIEVVSLGLFVSLPLFANFIFLGQGYDSFFHFNRIVSLAQELEYGQFPVRITRDLVNGYGYINPLFYCDIFLYPSAILYNCMVPLMTCYKVYVVAVNFATILVAYYSFKLITEDRDISMIGAAIYTMSSYRMLNVYTIVGLGTYTAAIFLPVVIASMYRIYKQDNIKFQDWILLSIGMSGIICSHILSTQMVVGFLVIFCIVFMKKTLQPHRFISLLKATGATICMTDWFIVPMLNSINMYLVVF